MTPFEVLDTDIDQFITLCNYLINLDNNSTPAATSAGKETRIKVNDKTATGGWW
jgi:hypothetical protein